MRFLVRTSQRIPRQSSRGAWIGRALVACGIGSVILAGIMACAGITINLTPSIPVGLYRSFPYTATTPIVRGTLVLACLPATVSQLGVERHYITRGRCPSHVDPIGKHVLAMPGDTLVYSAHGVMRQGHLIPGTAPLPYDHSRRPLHHIQFGQYVVGPHELWLYTTRQDSWDSRYWGPIKTRAITAVLHPLCTWSTDTLR